MVELRRGRRPISASGRFRLLQPREAPVADSPGDRRRPTKIGASDAVRGEAPRLRAGIDAAGGGDQRHPKVRGLRDTVERAARLTARGSGRGAYSKGVQAFSGSVAAPLAQALPGEPSYFQALVGSWPCWTHSAAPWNWSGRK